MFGLLKNKLSNFIKGLTGREEGKEPSSEKTIPPAEAMQQEEKFEQASPQEKILPVDTMPHEEKAEVPVSQVPAVEWKKETKPEEKIALKEPEPPKIEKIEQKEAPKQTASPVEPSKREQVAQKSEEQKPVAAEPRPEERKKSLFDSVASVFAPKKELKEGQPNAEVSPLRTQQPKQEPPKPAMVQATPEVPTQTIVQPKPAPTPQPAASPKIEHKQAQSPLTSSQKIETPKTEVLKPAHPPAQKIEQPKVEPAKPLPSPTLAPKTDYDLSRLEKKAHGEKRGMAPKIGLGTAIKSFFSNEITIGEGEVSDLLSELELSLLEADVAYDVSLEVASQLRSKLVGMKVPKGEVESKTKATIAQVLEGVMESERKFDFMQKVKSCGKPVKILFVGPNGAGKTTTMAKVARMLLDSGLTVVFSASDTFRAAAIEQTEVHADKLGIKAIKSKYGADPSSVAFDAINFAKANAVDVVLVDSAGRQDTNANLLSELKKINRVAQPDIKLYVGESIGGNSIIEQIKAFHEAIGLDGAILTKIDCDAKGGTAISIAKTTGIPIVFLGIGQGYGDLVPFDAHKLAQEIMT
jgi:fused signal recognition particle receptor